MCKDDLIYKAILSRAEFLEDILAGLISNGVAMDEIQIVQYRGSIKTYVIVRGVVRYTWDLTYNGESYFK